MGKRSKNKGGRKASKPKLREEGLVENEKTPTVEELLENREKMTKMLADEEQTKDLSEDEIQLGHYLSESFSNLLLCCIHFLCRCSLHLFYVRFYLTSFHIFCFF